MTLQLMKLNQVNRSKVAGSTLAELRPGVHVKTQLLVNSASLPVNYQCYQPGD